MSNVTPPALPESARISLIEASLFDNGIGHVAANRHQLDDQKPMCSRRPTSATWTSITTGVAPTHFARQLREDPNASQITWAPNTAYVRSTCRTGSRCS